MTVKSSDADFRFSVILSKRSHQVVALVERLHGTPPFQLDATVDAGCFQWAIPAARPAFDAVEPARRFDTSPFPAGSSTIPGARPDRETRHSIPPAWTHVWISTDPLGHAQAVGRDARVLPGIRARVEKDLHRAGLHRNKVLRSSAFSNGRCGEECTTRDFLAWNGGVLAATAPVGLKPFRTQAQARRNITGPSSASRNAWATRSRPI